MNKAPSAAQLAHDLRDGALRVECNDDCEFVCERYEDGDESFRMTWEGDFAEAEYVVTVVRVVR